MVPSFARLEAGYAKLWSELAPAPEHMPAITAACQGLIQHYLTYQAVADKSGVPWWWIAITDQMEGGGGARHHLHNGDPLSDYTKNVPAGRPKVGHGPPFTFEESALDALKLDEVDQPATWTVEYAAYRWEAYNGWGYLNLPIADPYLAAWSNQEGAGKFVADHKFDPSAHSEQPGALPLLKVLITLDPNIVIQSKETTTMATAPTPVPAIQLDYKTLETLIEEGLPLLGKFVPQMQPFIPVAIALARALLQAQPPATGS